MDLLPTPEQDEIIDSIRSVLADRHTLGEPLSDPLWTSAVEQGWFGLGVAEADGGVGYSIVEEALLFAEIGASCAPGAFLATALAAHIAPTAVLDGPGADLVLLIGDVTAELHDIGALGELTADTPLDGLVPVSVAATPQGTPIATGDVAIRAHVLAGALLAGIARSTCEQSVSYAKDREQFGQPIGGFQAVKHRCADMAVRADAAINQVRFASLAVRDCRDDAAFGATAGHLVAANAAIANAQWNIQNHGGIGFTWEHTAHRYLTRARIWAQVCGGGYGAATALLAIPSPV
jgi:alkylation response protein AidB-like acyl-CoA dehydrogenase